MNTHAHSMWYHWHRVLVASALVCFALTSDAETIDTSTIVSRTTDAALSCARYQPIGVCLWLQCNLFECDVRTSIKVGPLSARGSGIGLQRPGRQSVLEARSILASTQARAAESVLGRLIHLGPDSAGNRTEGTSDKDHKNLIYREADLIGHPVALLTDILSSTGYVCESQSVPGKPYFQSAIDAGAWRNAAPEIFYLASVIPGFREIGQFPLFTWGSVHPRTGWVIQAEEPKAAAVIAQRAADIATRTAQPHLYLPLKRRQWPSNQQVWPPGPLKEADYRSGTWQMLTPKVDRTCSAFGSNDLNSRRGWGGGRLSESGDYIFNLWRPYRCCPREGQIFLGDLEFVSWP